MQITYNDNGEIIALSGIAKAKDIKKYGLVIASKGFILCDVCKEETDLNDTIETHENKYICFACDTKRLIKEQ